MELSDAVAHSITKKGRMEKHRLAEMTTVDLRTLANETLPARKKKDHPREALQLLEDWYQKQMDASGRAYLNAESKARRSSEAGKNQRAQT